ncbi:tenascin C [Cavenderia fasciculata]|uniref:Tenascin C n=1 Tax=Cavenderia fasciculata TaxID=261658 RepID=F4PV58_CACFS|nr:tenascin C [Cavenderia fasciculata]EGG21966.1 tenascin C [Cavenderia fasciculata]|eukprot:XP_004359817.1 tenascin C [Cavenderia fasciculata]
MNKLKSISTMCSSSNIRGGGGKTTPPNYYYFFISLLIFICYSHTLLIIGCNAQQDQLPIETVNALIDIRTAFSLQSVYPDDTSFCTANLTIIQCKQDFTTVIFLTLDGGGTVHLPLSVTVLTNLTQFNLTLTFISSLQPTKPPEHYQICDRCNISKFEASNVTSFSQLTLLNNPIEGNVNLDNFPVLNQLMVYTTDPTLVREVYYTTTANMRLTRFYGTMSAILNMSYFPNLTDLSIYIGENFQQSSFSFFELPRALALPLVRMNDVAGSQRMLDYPRFENWYRPTALVFNNVNFNPVLTRPNYSNCTDLLSIVITNSERLGNNVYPTAIHSQLKFYTCENCGLTDLFPFPIFLTKSIQLLSLNRNRINKVLPVFPSTSSVSTLDLRGNQLIGAIDNSYCSISFTNYQPSNGVIPPCTTLKITKPALYTAGAGIIEINGEDLGFYPDRILPDPALFVNYAAVQFKIPNKRFQISSSVPAMVNATNSGSLKVYFLDLNNASLTVQISLLPPKIDSITTYFDSDINGYVEVIVPTLLIRCKLPDTANMEENYYLVTATVRDGQKGSFNYPFIRYFPTITAITSPPRTGGPFTISGQFGENFTVVALSVGGVSCPIEFINSTTIFSRIAPGSGIKDVRLTVAGLVMNRFGIFSYEGDDQCYCSDNGVCAVGGCSCYFGWTGPICGDRVVPSNSTHGVNGSEIESEGIKFGFRVAGIREVDIDDKVVREFAFSNWTLSSSVEPVYKQWTYFYDQFDGLNPVSTNVSYSIREYTQQDSFEFAGVPLEMDIGSLKMTATVNQWPYLKSTNSIEIMLQSYSLTDSKCSGEIVANQVESTIKYITIMRDGKVLYARFIDRVLSDGRSTFSRTRVINQTEAYIYVGIGLPYCPNQCILDPDFSILIQEDGMCKSSSNDILIISVSVVVSLVGASAILIAVFALRRKAFFKISLRHGVVFMWKTRTDTDEPNSEEMKQNDF